MFMIAAVSATVSATAREQEYGAKTQSEAVYRSLMPFGSSSFHKSTVILR